MQRDWRVCGERGVWRLGIEALLRQNVKRPKKSKRNRGSIGNHYSDDVCDGILPPVNCDYSACGMPPLPLLLLRVLRGGVRPRKGMCLCILSFLSLPRRLESSLL